MSSLVRLSLLVNITTFRAPGIRHAHDLHVSDGRVLVIENSARDSATLWADHDINGSDAASGREPGVANVLSAGDHFLRNVVAPRPRIGIGSDDRMVITRRNIFDLE